MNPLVTVIVTAYNRVNTISRTMQSIIKQTYVNIEIVVIDDGSDDNTVELLEKIEDKRIRIIRHSKNQGVTAAKNTGLDNIRGEWFVFVDSDDEIVPEAIETMMKIPLEFDHTVTAVDSGEFKTESDKFAEQSLKSSQYVDEVTIIRECGGDVWGMIKTSLLGNDRFNNNLPGLEDTLWYKINARSKRYYIHKKLSIYHTEGVDRVSKKRYDLKVIANTYKALLSEEFFLNRVKMYNKKRFTRYCLRGILSLSSIHDKSNTKVWLNKLKQVNFTLFIISFIVTIFPGSLIRNICKIIKV